MASGTRETRGSSLPDIFNLGGSSSPYKGFRDDPYKDSRDELLKRLQSQKIQLQGQLKEQLAISQKLNQENGDLRDRLTRLQEQFSTLEERLQEAQAQNVLANAQENEIEGLREQIQNLMELVQAYRQRCDALQETLFPLVKDVQNENRKILEQLQKKEEGSAVTKVAQETLKFFQEIFDPRY